MLKSRTFTEEHKKKLSDAHKGFKHSKGTKIKMSKSRMGHRLSAESILKIRESRKNQPPPRTGKMSEEHKRKIGIANSGNKSSFWRGGITEKNYLERVTIMNSLEYKLWRIAVFVRDNYTCLECKKVGGRLQADHIKPFSLYPELRFAIDNGRTLCEICHRKTDTYGWNLYNRRK